MANKITELEINPTSRELVSALSRYANATVIRYGDRNLLTFKTYKKANSPLSSGDRFTVIKSGTEYRPDLLSQQFYGTVEFWWKIMEANNIKDVFEFKSGTNIRLPADVF